MAAPDQLELTVESVAQGGRGFARINGKATFIGGALPGERVLVEITRRHKSFDEARVVERLASLHGKAPCIHAEACGGCDWMRWRPDEALHAKSALVKRELERGFPDAKEGWWQDPVPSPENAAYRCRVSLKLKKRNVGYFAAGTHDFVPITECLVAAGAISRAIGSLRADLPGLTTAGYTEVELRATDSDEKPIAILRGKGKGPLPRLDWARGVAANRETVGDCTLPFEAADVPLEAGPWSFVQINLAINDLLVRSVLSAVPENAEVVDAFCGMGNFSLPLAMHRGCRVLGMEGNAAAIADARSNAARLGIEAAWEVADEVAMMRVWREKGFSPNAVLLLDPPRAGARRFIEGMLADGLLPDRIVYVSCEPSTLARDLRTLAQAGYRLAQVGCFDMFPQTHHVETLAILSRH